MESKRNDMKNQKVTMALFFIKENNETQLFKKWNIYIGKRYLIGRKDSDINIDNPLVSRRHLEITFYTFDQIKVKDLGSRNGTFINNGKATPNQEIKFTSQDKLSLGDINNKIVFMENQEVKPSVFNNPNNENIEKNSESTKIIENNNNKRRIQYNKYNNYNNNRYNRYNNRYRYRIRQRFVKRNRDVNYKPRARSFRKSPISKPKQRDIYSDNYLNSSNDINKTPLTNHVKSYSNKNLNKSYDKYLKNEIREMRNELIGKKVERNKSKNDDNNKRKNLVKLIKNKKIGLEKLKKKLRSIDNDSGEEEDEEEDDGEENDINIIDLDEKIGNKNEKIILKSKKFNNLEFVVDADEKNITKLKKVKKIKYLVNGYLVLNVQKKKFIYDDDE